jgi:hypothetical protein
MNNQTLFEVCKSELMAFLERRGWRPGVRLPGTHAHARQRPPTEAALMQPLAELLMISRRSATYSWIIRRASLERVGCDGGSSLLWRGSCGGFMPPRTPRTKGNIDLDQWTKTKKRPPK